MATKKKKENDTVRLAKQAASELLKAMPFLMSAEDTERRIRVIQALNVKQNSAVELKTAIHEDSSFGDIRGGWIQGDSHGMLLQDHILPYILINSALNGKSIEPIIAEARSFAKSGTCITEKYTAIAGVTVSKPVSLGKNIDLVPWTHVPDDDQKRIFGPDLSDRDFALMRSGFSHWRATAASAIRIRSPKHQVLFSSNKDAEAVAGKLGVKDSLAQTLQVQDAIGCITALSVRAVVAIGSWSRFDLRIANAISSGGYSYDGTLFDRAVLWESKKPEKLDKKAVAELFGHYQKLNSPEKDVMRIALARLNQALRRQNMVDKAIDLGIALEVMLLHGIGEGDRGEMRYRSSIRGASFLGKNKAGRVKIFKRLRDTYDLRSAAVHSGVIKSKKGQKPPEKILEEAIGDCANIARKLIDRESFPDWDTEYVIGGK